MSAPGRVINLGSINIDHVYQVPQFVAPGETLASTAYRRGAGGKGFNQSIALARAGAAVWHAGAVGEDGRWLVERLAAEGVDVAQVHVIDQPTGHAIIQVSQGGENAIILHPGANHAILRGDIAAIFEEFGGGDHCLCQNETTGVAEALRLARARGLTVWFNPAPITATLAACDLTAVDWLIVNETEGAALTGEGTIEAMMRELQIRCPRARIVVTLGAAGVVCAEDGAVLRIAAPQVTAVDTTGAGDTFVGYLIAAVVAGAATTMALERACLAASLSVQRSGAADSVPRAEELFASK